MSFQSGLQAAENGASADEPVSVIEDNGLSGCDGPLGFIEFDDRSSVVSDGDGAGMDPDAVADLGFAAEFFRRGHPVGEIQLIRKQACPEKFLIGADDDPVFPGIQRDYIERMSGSNAQSLPLADGVVRKAFMPAQDVALCIDDVAGTEDFRRMASQEFRIGFFCREEADIL